VREFFEANPAIDVLFADFVVVNGAGDYMFHRKVQTPRLYHTWVAHLAAFTCATFFRRRLISDHQLFFDPKFRVAGDAEWIVRLLRRRTPMAVLRRFTSTFTVTGSNLGAGPANLREAETLAASAPAWVRRLKRLVVLNHRLRRFTGGIYSQNPFSYSLYTMANPNARTVHQVTHPTSRWKS
jgi:hypothetical protein